LYSLGAIMFHLTTGRLPHDASGQVAMIDAILKEPAPNPRNYNPDVPPRLGRVIGGLLEKDPRNRIQSARELLEELQGGPEGLQRTGRTIGERLYSLKDEIRESILDITTMLRIPSGSRRDEKQREGVGEREEPEGAKTTEKVENSLKPLPRFVNAWFEGREPILPLEVGISYKFKVNIGARREAETSQAAEFGEPDFGNKDALMLLVSFFSEDFAIDRKTRQRPLKLLKIGDSEAVETMVSPLHQGACRIEIAISLQVELDLLQTLDFEVQAVEATVAQSMGD
jgi:serine/threonine protein kinase